MKNKNVSNNGANIGTIISLLKSMAFVRYKNNVFLDQLCSDIIKLEKKCSHTQIANILHSFATLGYHSRYVNDIIEVCIIRNLKTVIFIYCFEFSLI